MTEHEELLGDVLARCEIDCVIDAGAHLGQFGEFLRGLGYEGEIVSFEPVLPVFAALAKAASADERWQAHRLALGDEDGTGELNVPEATDFASFLLPNAYSLAEFGGHTEVERTEQVPVRRLDGVIGEYAPAMTHVSSSSSTPRAGTSGCSRARRKRSSASPRSRSS